MTNSTIGSTSDLIYGLCYTDKKLPDMEALWKKLETVDITEDDMLVLPKGAKELLGSSESREMKIYVRPCYKDLYDLIYGEHKAKHIIVIGNPGIGKSYFLLYLMFRLRKKDKDMSLFFHLL